MALNKAIKVKSPIVEKDSQEENEEVRESMIPNKKAETKANENVTETEAVNFVAFR